MSPLFFKAKNSIVTRCQKDEWTCLRLKYKPYYHTFEKQCGSHVWWKGREMIMLSSNDYLGLSFHPDVLAAGKRGLSEWGSSPTGARLSNGSRRYHTLLEEKLANFLGKEACHVSVAGYISCMSAVQAFAQKGDLILADKNLHSSLWAGIAQTQARVERFAHNNVEDLKEILSYEKKETPKILILEGVYSMEGHIAPLPLLLNAVADQNCFCVLDDAHGFGVLGEEGRGTAHHFGVVDRIEILAGSFSKSLASTGGFVAGSRDLVEYLRTHSKQTIFSASLAPSQAYCAMEAIDVLQREPAILTRLWENTRRYKAILKELKLDIWESETPAVPIVLGSKERVFRFWQLLREKGIFTVISIAPAVPPCKDLLRTAISASHTEEDLERIAEGFHYAIKRL